MRHWLRLHVSVHPSPFAVNCLLPCLVSPWFRSLFSVLSQSQPESDESTVKADDDGNRLIASVYLLILYESESTQDLLLDCRTICRLISSVFPPSPLFCMGITDKNHDSKVQLAVHIDAFVGLFLFAGNTQNVDQMIAETLVFTSISPGEDLEKTWRRRLRVFHWFYFWLDCLISFFSSHYCIRLFGTTYCLLVFTFLIPFFSLTKSCVMYSRLMFSCYSRFHASFLCQSSSSFSMCSLLILRKRIKTTTVLLDLLEGLTSPFGRKNKRTSSGIEKMFKSRVDRGNESDIQDRVQDQSMCE